MSRFDAVRPSGTWANEFVPTATDYQRWDVAQSKFLNASDGGIWNPTTPIRIGGAGMTINGGCNLFGGVTIGAGATLTHGTADVVTFSNVRSRTIVVPFHELQFDPTEILKTGSVGGSSYALRLEDYVQVQPPPMTGVVLRSMLSPTFTIPKRCLHHIFTHTGSSVPNVGAPALASATLNFRVLTRPPALPSQLLSISIVGLSTAEGINSPSVPGASQWVAGTYTLGQYVAPATLASPIYIFRCTTAGTSGGPEPAWDKNPGTITHDGSTVQWTCIGTAGSLYAATVDQYYAGGLSQPLTQTFDWANQSDTLDCSLYRYALSINSAPTDGSIVYESLALTFNNITSAAYE
jgi:hypothetical protein